MKQKHRIMLSVTVALVLAAVFIAIFRTEGVITYRTSGRIYRRLGGGRGWLLNFSRKTIEISASRPLIYQLSNFGWRPDPFLGTMRVTGKVQDIGALSPGGILSVDLSPLFLDIAPQTWVVLEQPYHLDGVEYVVYSNRFATFRGVAFPLSKRPSLVTPLIHVGIVNSYTVSVTNYSTTDLWFSSICSETEPVLLSSHSPYSVLQRQSEVGTWQVFLPDKSLCVSDPDLIRVRSRETAQVNLEGGYSSENQLDPGKYRWLVVLYIDEGKTNLGNGRAWPYSPIYLFTETFEIQ